MLWMKYSWLNWAPDASAFNVIQAITELHTGLLLSGGAQFLGICLPLKKIH
jgi:hypothetical protein